jgi:hypothetical protein
MVSHLLAETVLFTWVAKGELHNHFIQNLSGRLPARGGSTIQGPSEVKQRLVA